MNDNNLMNDNFLHNLKHLELVLGTNKWYKKKKTQLKLPQSTLDNKNSLGL